MAKIIYSGLISDVSGSIGNATFSHANGQPRIYQRPPTKLTNTPAILLQHQFIATANKDWAALDSPAKKFWREASLLEAPPDVVSKSAAGNGRLFYIGWRVRCLHAGASCAFDTLPPLPVYGRGAFQLFLFRPGLSVSWYSYPPGGSPPYPRCAAWLSWPAKGTQRPGRKWFKFWPVPGYENKASGVDLDTLIYNAIGIPPEVTAEVTGYYHWKHEPLLRSFGVFASGKIIVQPKRFVQASPLGYYCKFPPDPPVFSGYAA